MVIVVNLSKKLGTPIKERVAMTDFVWDVLDLSNEKGYNVFLFGGKEEVLEKAMKIDIHILIEYNAA